MANVKFLRGTLDKFNELTSYIPGAFYLVMDGQGKPGRLYYGVSESLCSPVNQGITTVRTLPPANANNAGSFYYIEGDNILAISNGKGWIQANTDTYLDTDNSLLSVYSNVNNNVTVKEDIRDTRGNTITFLHNIIGSDNIKVEVDKTNSKAVKLSLDGVDYSLALGLEGDNKLNLKLNNGTEAKNTLAINAGDGVNFKKVSDTEYTISADSKVETFTGSATSGDSGFSFNITGGAVQNENGTLTAKIDPQIKVGANGDIASGFENSVATLNVYTIPEIDDKLRTLNAMVFRGLIVSITDETFTFSVGGNSQFSTADLQIGDTFKYRGDDTLYDNNIIKTGDIFIASGTEDENGKITPASLTWTYIPSADEPLVEIGDTLTNNFKGFQINRGDEQLLRFTIEGASDGGIDVSAATNKDAGTKVISLSHKVDKKENLPAATKTQTTNTAFKITVNNVVSTDSHGHVLQLAPTTYTLTDTHAEITNTNHTFGDDHILYPTLSVDGTPVQLSPIQFTSDSLKLTSNSTSANANAKLNLELEWGNF